jgi:hypoxanthine phosphoribosyltransferase
MTMRRKPRVWLSTETIKERIVALSKDVNLEYDGKRPVVLGLLRGCVPFLTCLMQQFQFPFDLEFCQASTYPDGTEPSGDPAFQFFGAPVLQGREVLVVDDIVDTGATLVRLLELLREQGAASVRLCTLLDKPMRRKVPLVPDWVGFEIPDRFVVGFGMDLDGDFRGLPWIGTLD